MSLISIIIPIYNIEKYLSKCLESITNQTFNNYEVILVDDGSFDNCASICDEYANNYDYIKVIHKKNGGLVSARKEGLKLAKGDYIACVDGDDWVDSKYIEALTNEINKRNKPDIICFNYCTINNNSYIKNNLFKNDYYLKNDIVNEIYPALIQKKDMTYFSVSIWNKIYKTSLYKEIQNKVDDAVKIGEDRAVSIPCIYKAESISTISNYLYYYRKNDDSMTNKKKILNTDWPKKVVDQMNKTIDVNSYDFNEQIDRFFVHQLFVLSATQFNMKNYKDAKKTIIDAIDIDYYQKAINNSKFKGNLKAYMVQKVLKYKLIFIIKLYSLFR